MSTKTKTNPIDEQTRLICRRMGCTPEGVSNLTTLYAGGNCGITDAGLKGLKKLTTLYAGGNCGITAAGYAHVAANQKRKQL